MQNHPETDNDYNSEEDTAIINQYFAREENAIAATDKKYGRFCYSIAYRILSVHEDAEECVNDTYVHTWNVIPPQRPLSLKAFLGSITRNLSISRYRKLHAEKRSSEGELLLSELEDCIPDRSTERELEQRELSEMISDWLESLPREDCAIFVRRYWKCESVRQLAFACGVTPNKMAQKMMKLRLSLKEWLQERGESIE